MGSNSNVNVTRDSIMDLKTALSLASDAYFRRHEKAELPAWFKSCITVSGLRKDNVWIVHYSATPFAPLKEHQHWEVIRGNRMVVEVDPITGQRSVLITRDGPKPVVIFEALVNVSGGEVVIQIDRDLSDFDETTFESSSTTAN
jgi:hypothetical protein